MWISFDDRQLRLFQQRCPELAEKIKWRDAEQQQFFAAACENSTDAIEFDPDAVVSVGDEGAFVMGWFYVSNEDAGIEELEDTDAEDGEGAEENSHG